MVFALFDCFSAEEIACETIENNDWFDTPVGTVKTCLMRETTVINEADVTIATNDESIGGLSLYSNRKIKFLPVQVGEKLPNLLGYSAYSCSIKTISKENFAGLNKLKVLYLNGNQIEKVNRNTFEGLVSLEDVRLCKKIELFFSFSKF